MDANARLTVILFVISILVLPTLALMVRIVIKWTRMEAKMEEVTQDLRAIVESKDQVHREITEQMGRDREATDKRLRWLEEHLWKQAK